MYVPRLLGVEHLCMKASVRLPVLSRSTCGRYYRTLLDNHWHRISTSVDNEVRSYRKGQVIVRNCILYELIVQFLQFSISVLISFKESSGILYFGKIGIAKPRYLLSFGKFRKTVYMFHLSC